MLLKDTPIRRKLMLIILLTSGAVLLLTCAAFFTCELVTFRQAMVSSYSVRSKIIAANSTASLAFENVADANEVLSALKVDPHVTAACLYDKDGKLFATYPAGLLADDFPAAPEKDGLRFERANFVAFQPVVQGTNKRLGTLYLKSDLNAMDEQLQLYVKISAVVIVVSFLLAYLLSRILQKQISRPIFALAETARAISDRQDYSVRAAKLGEDELGSLTDAFNEMLTRIQKQNESVRRLAAIVESSDDAIISKTMDGIITSWNPGAQKLFGYPAQEAVGKPMTIIIPPARMGEEPEILARVARGKSTDHFETVRVRKDGVPLDVSVTISPIRNERGEIVGASTIARDIAERKRAEAEIKKLNTDLERRVIERTGQLEAANKELEAFSYSVSHDLRAPLRAVNGFAGIVLEDYGPQLPDEGRKYLERIRDGGQRMGILIDDLLSFARLSRQPMSRRAVDTEKLVQTALDELKPQFDGRPVEFRIEQLPACYGDPALLKQVWVNLLSNAIKYSRNREPALVEIGAASENGGPAFFVRDNGTGFDMQYAHKLFGVFQRLHRADEFEGTGVGLAIVQRIVHRHGGHIWAEAAMDHGATFHFTLENEIKNEPKK